MSQQSTTPDPLRVLHERPDECARQVVSPSQVVVLAAGAVTLALFLAARPIATLVVLNAAAILFYLAHILYKARLVYLSLERPACVSVTPEELRDLRPELLPSYTILVPLHREAAVLPQLVAGLAALDYPDERYTVLLLLEEDDGETRQACEALSLPANFRPVIVPHSEPKTKPKACNWGLEVAESDLLVIYDAEDRPDRDQLLKAAAVFRKLPRRVACLQARLNYYNPRQNLLTRLFTAEYTSWFDLFLPGLTSVGGPIPLGGTSNHFKTAVLRALGGWDPFNVTEDCDLGVRLHKHGYRTAMIDSTTWEEANSRLRSWVRQRSRWVKGYLQTYLVHMRSPWRLLQELGVDGFVNFQMMIGGSIACFLLNPIYWVMTLLWLVLRPPVIQHLFAPLWVYEMGVVCLFAGNFLFIYLSAAACASRQQWDLVKYSLLMPLYWVLMSLGAYKAAGQLLFRPFYWEKTDHGFFRPQPPN